jgi:outer membrane protein assembly factor BamB
VRRGGAAETQKMPVAPATRHTQDVPAQPRSRMARRIILGGGMLTVLLLIGVAVLGWWWWSLREERLARRADEKYEAGLFAGAADDYDALVKNFPGSDQIHRYQFRAELSKLRGTIKDDMGNLSDQEQIDLLNRLRTLIEEHHEKETHKDRLLREHAADIGSALVQWAQGYRAKVGSNPGGKAPLDVIARGRQVIALTKKIKAPRDSAPVAWDKTEESFKGVEGAVAHWQRHQGILRELQALKPSYASIVKAEEILQRNAAEFPDLPRSPEVNNLMDQLFRGHLANVRYVKEAVPRKFRGAGEEDEPSIIIDPLIGGSPGRARNRGIVLALARGVLYALDRDNGQFRWATRVGIDITALPVRVPPQAGSSERILVLSSDTAMLTAMDTDGNMLWRYHLDSPCLGRPVVVGQRAYLPTEDGTVHEIELIEGKLLGRFLLGQPLRLGGTREPGTSRIFFPADEGCVYVLNVDEQNRRCEAILYSRHPAFTLRGEPILVGPEGGDSSGFLILNQAAGLRDVELRVFELPIRGRDSLPQRIEPEVRLEGWTWFRPYSDPEKLVMLSDAGMLGLFGIRQRNNPRDPILFPFLPGGGRRLDALLGAPKRPGGEDLGHGRAEVVQMLGDDLWVLGGNQLQRLRLAWGPDSGPRLNPVWKQPLDLGSPLHASQSFEDRGGRSSLVVVTNPPRRATVWATCLDDESGDVRWQRQLGVVCEADPVPLAEPGQPPLLLLIDQGGALFTLDPEHPNVRPPRLAGALEENPDQPPVIVPADGRSVHIIACPGDGKELVVRRVQVVPGARSLKVSEDRAPLPARLAGTPAIVADRLLLPLDNDKVARVPLPLNQNAEIREGFDWRALRAPPDSRGHVLALGGDRFLTSDGLRQIRVWAWPADTAKWDPLPDGRGDNPTLELDDHLVAPPIRLPGKAGDPVRVCLADAGGKLSLAELQEDGKLPVKRRWNLGGTVTRGPFVQVVAGAVRVGCVVDRRRLVWIDPDNGTPLWTHDTAGGAAIVGRPHLAAGMIVLGDKAGRYVGLDPKTGKPVGPGYQLKGSIAPVGCPLAFQGDRLLAPLSDGTLLRLGVKRLKAK